MAGLKKLLKRHGAKKHSSKEDLGGSLAGDVAFGYSIAKEKDLPKIHKAVWNADTAKVKQLCKKGDINQFDKENRTPLHLASACGLDEITQFLLANKAKTNLCDNDGRTPLMKAVECSHLGCIQLLLEHNADVKATDKNTSSPLHLAAANNLINVATRLLEKGLSVNVSDKEGFTSLHVASSLGNQDFVLYLLNRGADVDVTDAHGRTPLMTAAADGHVDIVKMLLEHNADVTLTDSEGWKAADHAVMNGIHSCAKIIDDHEAKQAEEKEEKPKQESPKPKKKPDINEVLRTSSPVNEDLGFSFGGPAADKVSIDMNLRSEGSTSRQSDNDDSWASSSVDENSEVNKPSTKVSLAAALEKVDRSVSNISNKSQSRSPVRSLSQSSSPEPAPGAEKVKSPQTPSKIPRPASSKTSSPEARPTSGVSTLHSPQEHSATPKQSSLSPTASVKSAGSSVASSPRSSIPRPSPRGTSRVVSPTESMKSADSATHDQIRGAKSGASMPMEYLKPAEENNDSDQSTKGKVDEAGYSPSFLSPKSDHSNRNLADELGLSLGSSDDDDDFDDSVMSGEVALDQSINDMPTKGEKPKTLTSTAKTTEKQSQESKNPAAYLGLDLDSSISSVSDPDISGIGDKENARKKVMVDTSQPQSNQAKVNHDNEDTDSNWDSSEGLLPSDNEDIAGKSKSSKTDVGSNHNKELKAAVEKRRETLDKSGKLGIAVKDQRESDAESLSEEDGNDMTESESEWANEREESRKRELEKIKESALAKMKMEEDRQKEVEEKLRIEMERQKEEEMRQQKEKELRIQKQKEEELKIQKQKEEEQVKLQKQKEREMEMQKQKEKELEMQKQKKREIELQKQKEQMKIQKEEQMRIQKEKELLERQREEQVKIEKQKEEARRIEWEREQQRKELELAESIKKELEEEESDDDESYSGRESDVDRKGGQQKVETLGDFEDEGSSQWDSTEISENLEDSRGSLGTSGTLEDERVKKLGKQMQVKGQLEDTNNNRNIQEPVLVKEEAYIHEDFDSDDVVTPTNEMGDVSGYNGTKGGITEDARRIQKEEDALLEAYKVRQEEMLEHERKMEEDLARKELERVEGLRLQLEKQKVEEMTRMAELERQRNEREKKQEEQAIEKEREMKELKKKEQDERKRQELVKKKKIEEENKARLQNIAESSSELDRLSDSDDLSQSKAERALTEKHREFVDEAANSTAFEVEKVHNRERLADKSREIKQRQAEAKADLDAIRLRTTRLTDPSKSNVADMQGESPPKSSLRDISPEDVGCEQVDTSPPSNAHAVTSDWSTSSEDGAPLPRVKTPLSSGDGGLGSSLSPGLQSAIRPSLMHSMPLLSSSPAVMDSSPLSVQLKNSLRESKRQTEKSQEKLSLAETKVNQLKSHADELQSKLEKVMQEKSALEREVFDINEENRVLRHDRSRALEDKKISDALVETFKEQLARSEDKLNREIAQRRTVEETCKQLDVDRLNIENSLRQMTQEQEELRRAFQREHEQCRLKDELYNEQRKQIEEVITESQKVSQHRADVLTKLESVDESRRNMEASSDMLRKELIHAKSEVNRLNSQLESVTKFSQNEVDSFKAQLAEQTEKTRHIEDTLAKVRSEYDSKLSVLQSSSLDQLNKLESEQASRHNIESEAAVLRSRLETSENERNEANKTRIETERQLHSLREEMYKTKSSLEKELSTIRENYQLATLKLTTAENKVSSLEAELQTANIMLAERSNQMSINIRDIDNKRASVSKLETDLRTEKESNTRLTAKLEASYEKLRDLENESLHVRRQLELATESVRMHESSSQETQNKLHSTISEIKTDYEKTKGKMSENERRLSEAVEKYKEEIQNNFNKQQLQNDQISRLQQELVEATRKQSVAEASLEIQLKTREHLEEERDHLRQTLRDYEGQITTKISETYIATGQATVLQGELEHSRQVTNETSQRLATTSYDLESLEKTKDDVDNTVNPATLEGDVRRLKLDRVKLEATLNEEKAKTDILLREIKESNEGRTQLESLLAQIKSTNIELEEQLQAESFNKSQHAREAEEAKGLWESEVRARSKLGAKIIEMENKVNEAKVAIEEEKKKTRKALESRKVLQGKLELFEKRSEQHQKEVQTLKAQIKAYKRRVKEFELTERRVPTLQAEFNREIEQYEGNITSLRNQIRDLNEKLRQEGDIRALAERKEKQQGKEFLLAKAQTKEQLRQVQKLEKLNRKIEEEMEQLKENYNENFIEKAQLEHIKMDIEAKSRIQLNRKLADVNAHLEEQAVAREALERSRSEQEALKIKEMENTISKLKRENETYKSNMYQLQTEMQTKEVEADRFKDMYENETKRKQKLDDLLFKEREKSAESKAFLNLERSRSNKFLGNSHLNTSFLETSPARPGIPKNESMNSKTPSLMYSQPKEKLMESVDKELSKSIQRHLGTISTSSPGDIWTNKEISMTSSPLSSSTNQYMETLKRNYFV